MQTLEFTIDINAPTQIVWERLWSDEGYRKWTSVFSEGSCAESDWEKGSAVKFLDGKGQGMYAIIKEKTDCELMVFEHQGEVQNGQLVPQDWAGAQEAYYLSQNGSQTRLRVTVDCLEDYIKHMQTAFPKALNVLKEDCEKHQPA